MSDWQDQMASALSDFMQVANLAGDDLTQETLEVAYLNAPHRPTGLPVGKMAVYAFWGDGAWLKIGKAGAKSDARFRSQHYAVGRAQSSLANSLCMDDDFVRRVGVSPETLGDWIKSNTHRCNILLDGNGSKSRLSLLEAFLHHRLRPRYEG